MKASSLHPTTPRPNGSAGRAARAGSRKEKGKKPVTKPQNFSAQKHQRLFSVLVFAFAFLLYANTLNHGYVLDDDVVYLKNSLVQKGIAGIPDIFSHSFIYGFTGHNDQSYRPMVQVVYAIEKSLFDNDPHAQHFVNVLLFALSCLLLHRLLIRLFSGLNLNAPWLPASGALLFAAHPIHTEAVANIKGLDDILNFLFLALSLLFAFIHIERRQKLFFVLSIVFFFLSLLCKEMAVTFLAVIPLTIFFFTNRSVKKVILGAIPYFGAFVIYFLIRKAVLDVVTFEEKMKVVNNALAAATTEGDRIATALLILGKYIQLLFFPHPLSWDYSYNQIPIVSFSDIKTIITLAVFAALGFFALRGVAGRWKDPEYGRQYAGSVVLSYSILFFFLTMSVVSNVFIMIGATLGERFLFVPSMAFCMALAFFVYRQGKNIFLCSMGIILILFSIKTVDRNRDWKNNFALFEAGAAASPNSSRAVSALGSAYRDSAEKQRNPKIRMELFQKAIPYYQRAIEILPENTEALYNAGVTYYGVGDRENALKMYVQALKVSPDYTNAANNAGVIYFERGEYENAKKYFEQALQYQPNNSDALGNIGAINHNQKNYEEAIKYYNRALAVNPMNQNVRENLEKAKNSLAESSRQNR